MTNHRHISRRHLLKSSIGACAALALPAGGIAQVAGPPVPGKSLPQTGNTPSAKYLRDLHICTERYLTRAQAAQAPADVKRAALSVKLSPRAARDFFVPPVMPKAQQGFAPPGVASAPLAMPQEDQQHLAGQVLGAVMFQKKWPNTQTEIRVRFIDAPSATVAAKIQEKSKLWEPVIRRTIRFVDSGDAEIRISLRNSGSWSYIGTDSLSFSQDTPTLNFGWFDDQTDDIEFRRTTVHEFGHALGLIHEHQHPLAHIPYNMAAVYGYYKETQHWTKQEVGEQVLTPMSATVLQYSKYDSQSIMEYPIPKAILTDPNWPGPPNPDPVYAVGWNTDLSDLDRIFMNYEYVLHA